MLLADLVRKYVGLNDESSLLNDSDQREALRERAAILEHDGGLSRESAERAALSTIGSDILEVGSLLDDDEDSKEITGQLDFPFGANASDDEEVE